MLNGFVVYGVVAVLIGVSTAVRAQEEPPDRRQIDEIIVTASKRGEMSVQDVPMGITAIGEETLNNMGSNEFEDIYRFASGLNVADAGPGLKTYIIRGISLAGNIPAVGQYVDEWLTSVGNTPGQAVGQQFDAKLFDVNRVEVLKGPQGTLYGASAMGGIVRVITNKPDSTGFDYKVETDFSATSEGGDNLAIKGMINFPLVEDRLAVRGSAYWYDLSGFIDNVVTNEENINFEESTGFRASVLWTPNDTNALEVSVLYQDSDFGSDQYVMPNAPASPGFDYGEFGEAFGIADVVPTRGTGTIGEFETQKYVDDQRLDKWRGLSARWDSSFDTFTVTGIGTFARRDFSVHQDTWNRTNSWGPGNLLREVNITDTTTFEARAGSNWDKPVNWLVGVYYEQLAGSRPGSFFTNSSSADGAILEQQRQACLDAFAAAGVAGIPEQPPTTINSTACEAVISTIQPPGAPSNEFTRVGQPRLGCTEGNEQGLVPTCAHFYRIRAERDRSQNAVFGELRYDVTDTLQLAYGLRYYELEDEAFGDVDTLVLLASIGGTTFAPKVKLPTEDGVIHRVDVSYHFTDDFMSYFLYSEGYRQGGENRFNQFVNYPLLFDTDRTENYEIGLKSAWLSGSMLLNLSAYNIRILGIQSSVRKCDNVTNICAVFTDNVADAVTRGIELETVVRPSDNWSFMGSVSYGTAELDEDSLVAVGDEPGGIIPNPAAGFKGDRLPETPEITAALNARYDGFLDFSGIDLPAFVDLTSWYVGSSYTAFNDNDPFYFKNDAYTETRFRAGIYGDTWKLSLYVNNLFDDVNDLGSRARLFTTVRETVVNRPRTIGINFQIQR